MSVTLNKAHGPKKRGFNFSSLARCNAKNRSGDNCKQAAMKNGKCYFHGGRSTGPKTIKGKVKPSQNALKHGAYSMEEKAEDKRINDLIKATRELYAEVFG
ncbi:hypothetical protein MJH12_04675 [bacterium]|nr:hypothetical protein [bacterium]